MNVLSWHRSSSPNGDNCVEVGALRGGTGVAVRNSREPDGPSLTFTWAEWQSFLAGVKQERFEPDHLVGYAL